MKWVASVALLIAMLATGSLRAAEARASLSRDYTSVGNPVRLELTVDGGRADRPPDVQVDGLSISYMGPNHSTQITIENGRVKSVSKHSYHYRVTPEREGTFQIPGISLNVDGEQVRTQPIALRVEPPRSGTSGGGGQGAQGFDNISFAEIVLPKKTAYVGETLPVEIRLYVDSRITWQPETMPELEGEGFTKTKMPEPRPERGRRVGREYDVLVFRTAITPSKAGKVRVGPADLIFNAQIPRARPNRRSPFQDFFGDDFFNDPFFGGFGATERRKATAEAVDLEVKPLPAAGRPASFSGAVGKFTLNAEGTPKELNVGDPLTMNLTVSGRGNFDRLNSPVLKDSDGWRPYPPSSNFQPEDDVSYRGAKRFQIAVIPETKKTQMPQFEFSYFDPDAEKYVTLTSEPAPLVVKGEPLKPPAPLRAASPEAPSSQPAPTAPAAAAEQKPGDILGLRYDKGTPGSFVPIYWQPWFWGVQAIPLAGLIGFLGLQRWKRNAAARRTAALRRRKQEQVALMQRGDSRPEFLEAATRAIQMETALATGQDPATVDAAEACRSRVLDSETSSVIEELFQARAELLYAGVANGSSRLEPGERERFVAAVTAFEKNHGRN